MDTEKVFELAKLYKEFNTLDDQKILIKHEIYKAPLSKERAVKLIELLNILISEQKEEISKEIIKNS